MVDGEIEEYDSGYVGSFQTQSISSENFTSVDYKILEPINLDKYLIELKK